MPKIPKNKLESDQYSNLLAIWILASNDDNPIITYKSVLDRLEMNDEKEVEKLVKNKRELFRLGASQARLDEWKQQLRSGRKLPRWISDISDPDKRLAAINSITRENVFRSQFRTGSDAPPSTIEIIDWGLKYIEGLRISAETSKEKKRGFIINVLVPMSSALITLSAIITTFWIQKDIGEKETLLAKKELEFKRQDVFFKPRQEAWSQLLKTAYLISGKVELGDTNSLVTTYDELEASYSQIEPFLSNKTRNEMGKALNKLYADAIQSDSTINRFGATSREKTQMRVNYNRTEFDRVQNYFKVFLYDELFVDAKFKLTPNPTNGNATLLYSFPQNSEAYILIADTRDMKTLDSIPLEGGEDQRLDLNESQLGAGKYPYRIFIDTYIQKLGYLEIVKK